MRSQLHDCVPRAHVDAGLALVAFLLIDHGKCLVEFDRAHGVVLLADSASELAYLFYVTLACRAMSMPRRPGNVPSGSDGNIEIG
uniref:Uncharacterized protein n=1 Tax=uncultured Methanosarcinales archaeon TaxID=183757 RepID=A0A7H1KNH3_9EURY|nr:hypothetical protein ICMCNNFD_00004 [uncultured Methanosarcinales archaeon]